MVYRKRKIRKSRRKKNRKHQKGGAFGAGMALGMFLPQVLGTVGKVLKINV